MILELVRTINLITLYYDGSIFKEIDETSLLVTSDVIEIIVIK